LKRFCNCECYQALRRVIQREKRWLTRVRSLGETHSGISEIGGAYSI
jgi:hypothetical protein